MHTIGGADNPRSAAPDGPGSWHARVLIDATHLAWQTPGKSAVLWLDEVAARITPMLNRELPQGAGGPGGAGADIGSRVAIRLWIESVSVSRAAGAPAGSLLGTRAAPSTASEPELGLPGGAGAAQRLSEHSWGVPAGWARQPARFDRLRAGLDEFVIARAALRTRELPPDAIEHGALMCQLDHALATAGNAENGSGGGGGGDGRGNGSWDQSLLAAIAAQLARELARVFEQRFWIGDPRQQELLRGLSPCQREVLEHILAGRTERQAASLLHRSVHTVHDHVKSIYSALGVSSRTDLILLWYGLPHIELKCLPETRTRPGPGRVRASDKV